jgi:tellurite resistance protein TerA
MAIELRKGAKISLEKKSGAALGEIVVNLNWNQGGAKKGFFASLMKGKNDGVDLDLGCLYELTDGTKGCVQALGNLFGSQTQPPYISLDGDDRTGQSTEGETLRVNGNMIAKIKRVLVYTFIYEGVADWRQTDGVVTVKYPGSQDIVIRMDENGANLPMCGIALFENKNNETFTVEKIVRFFGSEGGAPFHQALDRAFGWGLNWVSAKK